MRSYKSDSLREKKIFRYSGIIYSSILNSQSVTHACRANGDKKCDQTKSVKSLGEVLIEGYAVEPWAGESFLGRSDEDELGSKHCVLARVGSVRRHSMPKLMAESFKEIFML